MSQIASTRAAPFGGPSSILASRGSFQAYVILRIGFAALPIIAGIDKFTQLLVNWDQYLAPTVTELLPVSAHNFMLAVGVIEIAAGIIVALWPRFGAFIVALWLWGIIVNLLLAASFYD